MKDDDSSSVAVADPENLPGGRLMSVEMAVDFHAQDEWAAWRDANRQHFAAWRETVLRSVRTVGLIEPVSGVWRAAEALVIDGHSLRETVSVAELNSRKRAGLRSIELLLRMPRFRFDRQMKVLAAEATTRAALLLRGLLPFFLGGEFLPTPDEVKKFFPIPHLDLQDISYDDASFDLFYSGDVFEHVPDLSKALAEIHRVLRPGGILVSTFPFDPRRAETVVKARLAPGGKIELLTDPEYHGNPTRPDEGSLVYTLPGWDILDEARKAGFADTKMTLHLSSRQGVVDSPWPGVMVFSAIKGQGSDDSAKVTSRLAAFGQQIAAPYIGPRLTKVIGLAGLPRSGTTMLTAVLSVHARICAVYEPWNADKDKAAAMASLSDFMARVRPPLAGKDVLVVKETTTQISFVQRLETMVSSTAYPLERDMIVLFRNPLHVFLSEVQARRDWWGEGNLELSRELFENWATKTLHATGYLFEMARRFNAVLVSYEHFVRDPELIRKLMAMLDIDFDPRQLDYQRYVETSQVRGDIGTARSPRAVGADSIEQREVELQMLLPVIEKAPSYPAIVAAARALDRFRDDAILRCQKFARRPGS